jgi:AhpD family alkylhydroperoxidase
MANPTYQRFIREQPQVSDAFRSLVTETTKAGALDEKTKQLIFLACTAASGYAPGMGAHIDKVLAAGGTAEEIREALAVIIPITGIMPLLQVYDSVEDQLTLAAAQRTGGRPKP